MILILLYIWVFIYIYIYYLSYIIPIYIYNIITHSEIPSDLYQLTVAVQSGPPCTPSLCGQFVQVDVPNINNLNLYVLMFGTSQSMVKS